MRYEMAGSRLAPANVQLWGLGLQRTCDFGL